MMSVFTLSVLLATAPLLKDLDAPKVSSGAVHQRDTAETVAVYPGPTTAYDFSALKLPEKLNRGLIAVRCPDDPASAFVTWRYLRDDPTNISFTVTAATSSGNARTEDVGLKTDAEDDGQETDNEKTKTTTLCWARLPYDETKTNTYTLTTQLSTLNSQLSTFSLPPSAPLGYVAIPLDTPPATMSRGANSCLLPEYQNQEITYSPCEASAGDLDGDGELELVLLWKTSHFMDNTGEGDTGPTIYEALKLPNAQPLTLNSQPSTSLWRIDMGINIRSGSHYAHFVVWDLDGDGKAEMLTKTSHGTVDGQGKLVCGCANRAACNAAHDYRDKYGRVLSGDEYLTVFDGETGAALKTVPYTPERGDHTNAKWIGFWGDTYGNRSERHLCDVGYLDGTNSYALMCRGYYARSTITAWRWDGKDLTRHWAFDTTNTDARCYQSGVNTDYRGQGYHSMRVADVDMDGKDEVIYGSMIVDHDGTGLFSTGIGHGDALHLVQADSAHKGLQVFGCCEHTPYGLVLWNARSGTVAWRHTAGGDTGRGVGYDADPTVRGMEFWGAGAMGVYDQNGDTVYPIYKNGKYYHSLSFCAWWGGDLVRYGLPGAQINKWDVNLKKDVLHFKFDGATSVNGSKSTPTLSADLFGDWREEVVLPSADGKELRVYVSTDATPYKFHTFLQDPPYRESVASQHSAYNQPTWPGFYFGPDLLGHRMWFRGQYLP